MVPVPGPAFIPFPEDFGPPQMEETWNRFFSDKIMVSFMVQLDLAVDGANVWPNRQLLVNQLKDLAREVSDDLVAVTCSNGMPFVRGSNPMHVFWSSVLAITIEYKNQRRVFQCLTAILQKVHCTTIALRRLPLVEDDLLEVENLHQTVICLLSCAIPKSFLIVCHRSPNPDKLMHLPEVQRNLQKLSEHVCLLQDKARTRHVDAMGCSGGDLYEGCDASFS
ncbi:hypothetical protein DL96DRAFT_1614543 [Flagelloscypha sp. PMI_526]|nr:hypothetical protein DL96DRAFT_1614543 [Flagelloscypha sp. PMI_526]